MEAPLKILVYNGPGTKHTNILIKSIQGLIKSVTLKQAFEVVFTSWKDLQDVKTFQNTKLLIIPGGRDLPYVEHIKSDAINNIKTFINNGGSFLGICAGAYFSCTHVLFDQGGPLEVTGSRELALLNGFGVGPVYPGFIYNSNESAQIVPLVCSNDYVPMNANSFCYYDGGGEFVPDENFHDFHTIAYYGDFPEKKAIVASERGKGKVILSFVHPEMSYRYLNSDEYTEEQWRDLVAHDDSQYGVFRPMIEELLK